MIHSQSNFQIDREMHAEIGYQILNKVLPSFRTLLVFNALLLSLSLGVFCYNNVPKTYLWLIIILIFINPEKNIFGTLVAIRNGLVISSFILGFTLIQKRKLIAFILLTLGLMYIHTSAIIFLPLAYLAGRSNFFSKMEIWLWIGVAITLISFSMTNMADTFALFMENDLFNRYESYIDEINQHRGGLMLFANVMYIILFVAYLAQRGKFLNPKTCSLLRIGLLFPIIGLMGSLATRSSYYLDIFLLASAVTIFTDKHASPVIRVSTILLVIATSLYSMIIWMNSEWWNHDVYHSLFGSW